MHPHSKNGSACPRKANLPSRWRLTVPGVNQRSYLDTIDLRVLLEPLPDALLNLGGGTAARNTGHESIPGTVPAPAAEGEVVRFDGFHEERIEEFILSRVSQVRVDREAEIEPKLPEFPLSQLFS